MFWFRVGSAVEAGACFDTTLGTTVEECISDAESIESSASVPN